jgi:hypothetical protein
MNVKGQDDYVFCLSLVCRILERIGARALSAHLRKFCDYLVFEFANSGGGQHVNKCVDAINDMIWKYNIVTIDRLVLCLVSTLYFMITHFFFVVHNSSDARNLNIILGSQLLLGWPVYLLFMRISHKHAC